MASLAFGRHKVSTSEQAMVSRPEVPRSTFVTSTTHKTTFDADYLIPIYTKEMLPGDTLGLDVTAYVRMATPLFPLMDNIYIDTFFFFVPNRIVWANWGPFQGETWLPDDPTDFLIPQVVFTPEKPLEVGGLADYFGIPPIDIESGRSVGVNALPFRGYFQVWNNWFRDQNLQDSLDTWNWEAPDGPDDPDKYFLLKRNKRHDEFTSALPWPQKGNAVQMPLSGTAPIVPVGSGIPTFGGPIPGVINPLNNAGAVVDIVTTTGDLHWGDPALEADLSEAYAASINTMRAAVAMQQLLELDARGGTRYTEKLWIQWGVQSQDSRIQRPEYLGGGSAPLNVTPVAQTSESVDGSPLGSLGGAALTTANHRLNYTVPEHGWILGLINVRADVSYQQGVARQWTRRTQWDFAIPTFANLGEQVVRRDQLYLTDLPAENEIAFGYQERFAEYRYEQSMITGMMRSGISGTLDAWHLAEYFEDPPVLDDGGVFITSNAAVPIARALAAGDLAAGQQFFADILFNQRLTRALPMRGTPGLLRF